MEYQDSNGLFGGFSLANCRGAPLMAALIVSGALVFLAGLFWVFRDVAQF